MTFVYQSVSVLFLPIHCRESTRTDFDEGNPKYVGLTHAYDNFDRVPRAGNPPQLYKNNVIHLSIRELVCFDVCVDAQATVRPFLAKRCSKPDSARSYTEISDHQNR